MRLTTKTKYQVSDAKCSNSSGCLRGSYLRKGHGRMTGEEDKIFIIVMVLLLRMMMRATRKLSENLSEEVRWKNDR